MRLAFVINNARQVQDTWTTAHLAAAAVELGHTVLFIEAQDFEVTPRGELVARATAVEGAAWSRETLVAALNARALQRRYVTLRSLDQLYLRVNPLSQAVTHAAMQAVELGVSVINDPVGVLRTRDKSWLAGLSGVPRPSTLVTGSRATAALFARNLGGPVVVKPTVSSGGRGVALVNSTRDGALEEAMAVAQGASAAPVVLQAYIPEAEQGEKRLVWVDGALLGGYLRRRTGAEFRHNLRCGSEPAPWPLQEADHRVADAISPHLKRNGIRIAGLDVIGSLLVEVNTLNPGGVHYAETFAGETEPSAQRRALGAEVLRRLTRTPVPSLLEARQA